MAETAKCSWYTFDRNVAVEGTLVGFKQSDANDLTYTGRLFVNTSDDKYYDSYKVVILGYTLWIDDNGAVTKIFPDDGKMFSLGDTLQMVVCEMEVTYGTKQAFTRSVSDGSEEYATLNAMEPRDQFAIVALQSILRGLDHPESYGDSSILFVCRSAYRWAQGMMIAAADARAEKKKATEPSGDGGGSSEGGEGEGTAGGTTRSAVDTSSGTDTEKLLGNIVGAVDDLTKQMKTNSENLLKATLKTATAVDNVTDSDNKTKEFKIEGGGGGGLDFDKLNDVAQNVSSLPVFNVKAAGRVTLANLITKSLASLSDDNKSTLYTALKAKMEADFDAKGAASTALADAKKYTDEEIAKKHPAN